MKVLFDQGTPAPLRHALINHQVETAYERAWSSLQNAVLIAAAEADHFEVFVTTDRDLNYQQNLATRTIVVVVLLSTSWPRLQKALPLTAEAVDSAGPGSCVEVSVQRAA